jgi:hypothetical protein
LSVLSSDQVDDINNEHTTMFDISWVGQLDPEWPTGVDIEGRTESYDDGEFDELDRVIQEVHGPHCDLLAIQAPNFYSLTLADQDFIAQPDGAFVDERFLGEINPSDFGLVDTEEAP